MTHEVGHIWCGGVGAKLGKKTIEIEDHEALNLAVNLKRRHNVSERRHASKEKRIAKLIHKIYEIAAEPGDEFHYYAKTEPHDH